MVAITFDTNVTGGSVTIHGNIVYGTEFEDQRYNQVSQRNALGQLITYDTHGFNVVDGDLLIKNVSRADGDALRTWIHTKAVFQLNVFDISTDNDQVDLGEGQGEDLVGVKFGQLNDKGVIKLVPPGNYTVKFPFTYVRST
jgi:hypothetical protein